MKKVIALTLVAVMLLCGCSVATGSKGSDTQPKESTNQGIGDFFSNIVDNIGDALEKEEEPLLELGQGAKQACIAILKISINPEFELYLDTDGCISRVRCLNEDAVTAFQTLTSNQINVIGLDYAEAMKVILDSIANAGFLTEATEQITIATTVQIELAEEELQTLVESFAEPVEQYSADNALTLTVEVPTPEVDTEAALELPEYDIKKGEPNSEKTFWCERTDDTGTYSGNMTVYYDENGIRYKEVEEYYDGFRYTTEYAANGAAIHVQYTYANGSGFEHFYDEYGNETKRISNSSIGDRVEITYHSNGNEASKVARYGFGGYSEEYWTKSGVPISSISIDMSGSRTECTWYENGNLKSQITDYSDTHQESHYSESGTLSKEIYNSSDRFSETLYYPNGQRAYCIDNSGESRWDESGNLTYEKYQNSTYSYLFENGAMVYLFENGVEITDPYQMLAFAYVSGLVP